jgi:hypothetical protein
MTPDDPEEKPQTAENKSTFGLFSSLNKAKVELKEEKVRVQIIKETDPFDGFKGASRDNPMIKG